MSKKQRISPPSKPPSWASRFLEWYCKPLLFEDLQGDLLEYFERNVERRGVAYAKLIYVVDVLKFFRSYTVQKPQIFKRMNQFVMFGNYFKTSVRSMSRNKLFTTINVAGLAVSMSVGLLMIAFITELYSYDDFHEKKDRIYRIVTTDEDVSRGTMYLASTSVKAGKLIREDVPGIETLTNVNNGFGGDAKVGEKVIPIGGFWADESFLELFTFPLLQGDPATALKEPYSLVLTEEAAEKLFGVDAAIGKVIKIDSSAYTVTGIMQSIPNLSYLRFEALASFSTLELTKPNFDGEFLSWGNIFMNHVYMVLEKESSPEAVEAALDRICEAENAAIENRKITLSLQSLNDVSVGKRLSNEIGPTMNRIALWILLGLTFVVIVSACFNYTNLSIARSMRRSREVGIRKVIGASRGHVIGQFLTEAVVISFLALIFSFLLFFVLRDQFVSLHHFISNLASLNITTDMVLNFAIFALVVGIAAGIFPALFFSRIRSLQVLKGASSLQLFRHVNMRRALLVVQYVFSLIFITVTTIGYTQYKSFLTFDLGFDTANVLNIRLQGNKGELLASELSGMPEVEGISQSMMITSLGSMSGATMKYDDPTDSTTVWQNFIDEGYLPLHQHTFLAGRNFVAKPGNAAESEVIVTEKVLSRFGIGSAGEAVGKTVTVVGNKLEIIGVVKDFHYETVEDPIKPVMLRYLPEPGGYMNVKIKSADWPSTIAAIEEAWEEIDPVHPFDARFYDEQIEQAYSQFSMMLKVIGFLAFLAICIASMGLFGMVVFTTETRLKEISIRKVLGAGEASLILLLGRGFVLLLGISALVALPVTYFFFDKVVLSNFAHHQPIGFWELFVGLFGITALAFIMIGTQTLKAARTNPANILRNE